MATADGTPPTTAPSLLGRRGRTESLDGTGNSSNSSDSSVNGPKADATLVKHGGDGSDLDSAIDTQPKRHRREENGAAAVVPEDALMEDATAEPEEPLGIPQTPPSGGAAHVERPETTRPALTIDPAKPTGRAWTPSPAIGLVFRQHFPVMVDKTHIMTPRQRDAYGQEWEVTWFPHGRFLDDEHVGVAIAMVADEHMPGTHSRVVQVEIFLVHPRNPAERSHGQRSGIVKLTKENPEFAVDSLLPRARLLSPADVLINAEGLVEIEVRVQFVDVTTEEPLPPALSPMDEADAFVADLTPVVTPTAAGSASALTLGASPANDLVAYDSKKETGMVGLKNQGATCYMNSLLQTLFHLRAFRQAVYATPTEQEDTNDSVSLALQRVFYRLQRQHKAVSTKELTRSFGWSQMDAFMQHDVQELYRILCDRLEEKMKNTKVDNAIKQLFEGKVRSFIQCVNVDFQSFRDESFYDLQLDVKGCKDIYASFRKYVEMEMLQGDNQYEAEGHGKQDAKKGVRFLQFPPVLNIQLKRFEYDPMRDGMVKIHDRFEFPKTLLLDEFAPKTTSAQSSSLVYHLHSVLVHSGDVHGGHYYVFIRPGTDISESTEWFKFDDDQISRVDEQYAVEGSFGSIVQNTGTGSEASTPVYSSMLSPGTPTGNGTNGIEFRPLDETAVGDDQSSDVYDFTKVDESNQLSGTPSGASGLLPSLRSFSSAYMLVYVRDGQNVPTVHARGDGILCTTDDYSHGDLTEVPIPEALVQRFHEEEKAAARRKKLQQTEHLYVTLRVASDSSVSKLRKITKTADFSSFGNNCSLRIRIKRSATIRQLYQRIYKRTGVPVGQQRLWKVITRENRTHRPDAPLTHDMLSYPVEALIDEDASHKTPIRLYLQIVTPGAEENSINFHLWDKFTPPKNEKAATVPAHGGADVEDDEEEEQHSEITGESSPLSALPAGNLLPSHILLFIKFYDVKKTLGERLEYMGNITIDSRKTGADLAKHLHEALHIPFSTELILYEEIQPISISEIDMDTSLEAAEIQHGDIVCYQYAEDEEQARKLSEQAQSNGRSRSTPSEPYPDVPSYFAYLLDRVEVHFHRYGHADEEPLVLQMLLSNVYDVIIDAVTTALGLAADKRLYIRLYQHSPLNGLPKKNPLRHSKYAGDDQTTLDDFLTEYSERTNIIYYEVLNNPITEIEAKKQVLVYFSIYDECFVDQTSPRVSRRIEFLVSPTATVADLFGQVIQVFELAPETQLRACAVTHNGSLVQRILPMTENLERYWSSSVGYSTATDTAVFIEKIPEGELEYRANSNKQATEEDESSDVIELGVVHFNFQPCSNLWIQPHGVPFVTYFREQDTVRELKERMRERIGISGEDFNLWNLAFVKDIKASCIKQLYSDMEPDVLEEFTMGKFEEICGSQFENIMSIGLEHADDKPITPKYTRRQEHGIRIRQG